MLWDNKAYRGRKEKKKSKQEEEAKPKPSQIEMEMIVRTMRSKHAGNRLILATLMSMGGFTNAAMAAAVEIHVNTLYLWKRDPEFNELVDRLTVTSGLAVKSNRIRFAKGVIQKIADERETKGQLPTEKDTLDWLKYIQSEAEGLRIGLSEELLEAIATAITAGEAMADSGSATISPDHSAEEASDSDQEY